MEIMQHQFSKVEYAARREKTLQLAKGLGCQSVFTFGENKNGVGITWLTGWGTTRLAYHFLSSQESILWILFHNHLPAAQRSLKDVDIRDFSLDDIEQIINKFKGNKIATFGVVPKEVRNFAQKSNVELIAIDNEHNKMRSIKSDEEIDALAKGAYATDCGANAIIEKCKVETNDWELLAEARSSYTRLGARDHICYLCVSDMTMPDRDVPAQFPEGRAVAKGSVVTFEISASVAAEYPGQLLRSIAVGEPSALFKELHAVADQALSNMRKILRPGINAMELVAASNVIEEAGFTTTDDLFHGLGAGYLQPIGTSTSRVPVHKPDIEIVPGMAIVLQPNVTAKDHLSGVQTGEMVIMTKDGFKDIHHVKPGFIVV
jgi:Xaa-Pro aminopeptidase